MALRVKKPEPITISQEALMVFIYRGSFLIRPDPKIFTCTIFGVWHNCVVPPQRPPTKQDPRDSRIREQEREIERLCEELTRVERDRDRWKRRSERLKKQLDAARRAGFRQAAPFAKDRPQGRGGGIVPFVVELREWRTPCFRTEVVYSTPRQQPHRRAGPARPRRRPGSVGRGSPAPAGSAAPPPPARSPPTVESSVRRATA